MKSITLIAPKSQNISASDISVLTTPLSGILILATILRDKGYFVRCFDELIMVPNYHKIDTDYVLITAMSATVNRVYKLADFFREKGKKVYMGGIHVSFRPQEALNHCNKVVIREAEHVILDLIQGKYKEKIINGSIVMNLDSIPLPDYSLVEGMSHNPKFVSICSSRGCPFNCNFCSIKNIFGRKYRYISSDRIINFLLKFKKIKTLCFDEPNFTIDNDGVEDILIKMKETDINPKYAIPSVSIDIANNEKILKLCSDVSQFTFLIGLESINQKVLDTFNKKQNLDGMKKAIKKIHDYGIKIQGSFIFGLDYDKKSIFKKTVDFCNENDIEFPIFCALTPYIGTDIRKKFEKSNRIITNNWDFYDGAHVVFQPKNITPYDLQIGIISAYENFYSRSKVINHIKKGEFFYGTETLYIRHLLRKILKKNWDYLENLERISS